MRVWGVLVVLVVVGASAQYRRRGPVVGPGAGAPGVDPPGVFTGTMGEFAKGKIRITFADGNSLAFYCGGKTEVIRKGDRKSKCRDLEVGETVAVESKHLRDGSLEALKVRVLEGADGDRKKP